MCEALNGGKNLRGGAREGKEGEVMFEDSGAMGHNGLP